jgi:hypothetical protein
MSIDELPLLDEIPRARPSKTLVLTGWDDQSEVGASRRRFLSGAVLGGAALVVGLRTLDLFGGRAPAYAAGYQSCTLPNSQLQNCGTGTNYGTSCEDGCPRIPAEEGIFFCWGTAWNARHRNCGETRISGPATYDFSIRHDACYTSSADGWLWAGVDVGGACNCQPVGGVGTRQHFGCNDGYVKHKTTGGYGTFTESICMTWKCAAG